jgi:polyisoprenoid-binding protein YceI
MQTTATFPKPATSRLTYVIDSDHASAQFKVRHLMVSYVRGELGRMSGEAKLDPNNFARSEIVARIEVAGVDTRNPQRDEHLRSEDFFDAAAHPVVTFRSTSVRVVSESLLDVTGALTIRGVTREVTLETQISDDVRDPWGNVKRGVTARTRIRRQDYGLHWNALMEAGGVVVGDDVDITIELELTRAAA